MGLFKRNQQATERVQDLKNRVESLRKVDDEHRALTLDDFLLGDDAVSARGEPRYVQSKAAPPAEHLPQEGDLEAELQRFLQHRSADGPGDTPEDDLTPQEPASPTPQRPISIDEFPPLPPRVVAVTPSSPPRLSADDEAALIAELQRYLRTDDETEDEGAPALTLGAVVDDNVAWLAAVPQFPEDNENEVSPDGSPAPETVVSTPSVVEIEGRTYEEPKPRHWPSTPRPGPSEDAPNSPDVGPAPRRVSDWEPL